MASSRPLAAWARRKTGIAYHDETNIALPNKPSEMPLAAARDALDRKIMEDDEIVDASERIEGFPFDIMVSFQLALDKRFGMASPCTVKSTGMFGEPVVESPDMISVPIDVDTTIQVPAGHFKLPGISGYVTLYVNFKDCCCILKTMDMKKKDTPIVVQIAEDVRKLLKTNSIYKGKAIHLHGQHGELDISKPPEFLETKDIDKDQLIFSDDLQKEIDDYLVTLIEDTDACEKDNIPLKRGYLLEGPYGVGKTLLARYLSKLCSDNGWTYLLIDNAAYLKETLLLAQRYEPALVFCEDIDRFASERTDAANDLLNVIDGVVSKGSKVVTCLTTNHIERIKADNQAILRPGRFDVVFSIKAPDAKAVQKLIRYYAGDLLDASESVDEPSQVLAGQIPAIIREAVERSKLSRIRRRDDKLSTQDILTAAISMDKHIALLESKTTEQTDAEKLAEALEVTTSKRVGKMLEESNEKMYEQMKSVANGNY